MNFCNYINLVSEWKQDSTLNKNNSGLYYNENLLSNLSHFNNIFFG